MGILSKGLSSGSVVKYPPAMQEMQRHGFNPLQSIGWKRVGLSTYSTEHIHTHTHTYILSKLSTSIVQFFDS